MFHCGQSNQTGTCGSLAYIIPDFLFLQSSALRNISKYSYTAKQVEEFSFSSHKRTYLTNALINKGGSELFLKLVAE